MIRGPFPPQRQGLGGSPSVHPDVWVNIVFLALFTIFGALHFMLFQVNMRKFDIKFPFNAATMGFCLTRVLATSLRIVWAYQQRNIHLAMTAQIFVYAGVIILIISNLWWSVRIIRAQHPKFGWTKGVTMLIPAPIVLSVLMIITLIVSVCVMFYLPDPLSQTSARRIQQTGATLFAVFSLLPIPLLLISTVVKALPSQKHNPIDNFGDKRTWIGENRIWKKVCVCLLTAILLSSGACFRAVTNYLGPIPIQAPTPWYFSKLCFYIFNFTLEVTVVIFWLAIRVDRLFWVPNGSKSPFSYGNQFEHPGDESKQTSALVASRSGVFQHSQRSSTATIPPVPLSRRSSWGPDVKSFMASDENVAQMEMYRISWAGRSNTVFGSGSTIRGNDSISGGIDRERIYSQVFANDSLDLRRPSGLRNSMTMNNSLAELPAVTSRDEVAGPVRETKKNLGKELGSLAMGFDPESGMWVQRNPFTVSTASISQYSTARESRPNTADGEEEGDVSPI